MVHVEAYQQHAVYYNTQQVNSSQYRLLQEVCSENVLQVANLLQQGVKINVRNEDGETPLHLVITRNNEPLTNLFLRSGVCFNF